MIGVVGVGIDDGLPVAVDDFPILARRIPRLRVLRRCTGEGGVEPQLQLRIVGIELDVGAEITVDAESDRQVPAQPEPKPAVELETQERLELVELEAEIDTGVEQLLAEPDVELERRGVADVILQLVAELVEECEPDVARPLGGHHALD